MAVPVAPSPRQKGVPSPTQSQRPSVSASEAPIQASPAPSSPMNWLTASSRMDARSQPGRRDWHSSLASAQDSSSAVTTKHLPLGPELSGSGQPVSGGGPGGSSGAGTPASGAGAPASLRSSSIFRPAVSSSFGAGDAS